VRGEEVDHTLAVDRFTFVRAVEGVLGEDDMDPPTRTARIDLVGTVLDQLVELAVLVAALEGLQLDVGVFSDQVRLYPVGTEIVFGLLADRFADLRVRSGPFGQPAPCHVSVSRLSVLAAHPPRAQRTSASDLPPGPDRQTI
jgi:hypothetical protein